MSNGNLQTITNNVTVRRTPDQIYFNPILSAIKNVSYDSNEVIISGIKPGYTGLISIDGAQIIVNNIVFNNEAVIKNDDIVKVRAYAQGIYGTVKRYTITAGEMTTYFDLSLVEVGSPIQDYSWTKYYTQIIGTHKQWKYSAYKLSRGTGVKFAFRTRKGSVSLPKVDSLIPTMSEGSTPIRFIFSEETFSELTPQYKELTPTVSEPNLPYSSRYFGLFIVDKIIYRRSSFCYFISI